ncbi:MAG: cation-translocating P-type ATPase [Pseudomonadota bacterium]
MQAAVQESETLVRPIHTAVPGRARYKVAGLQRSAPLKQVVEAGLAGRRGVRYVAASDLTGNVLVLFDPSRPLDEITAMLAELLRAATPAPGAAPGGRRLRRLIGHGAAQAEKPWHVLGAEVALAALDSDPGLGLGSARAAQRLQKYGPNVLPEAVPRSGFSILAGQFKSLPVGLLAASALVSVFTGGLLDALVIMGVVLINGGIGYATESQAEKTIAALSGVTRPVARARRDGQARDIPVDELVPGDILVLAPGAYVGADARLIEARQLSVDESALTGESLPAAKRAGRLSRGDVPLADRANMVYMGTLVTGGQGLAVVVATGRHTEIGRIQALVGEARPPATPMEQQLDVMGNRMVLLGAGVCGLVFGLGLLRGYAFLPMLKTAISLAVAAVPEGLPTVATTTLVLGIRRMRAHQVLIRHLDAVEALGAMQVICLDKTGTITLNRMSVVDIHTGLRDLDVAEGELLLDRDPVDPILNDELMRLMHVAVLCNESEVCRLDGGYALRGSPTENALVQLALDAGVDVLRLRRDFPRLHVEYRAEHRNFMGTVHARQDGRRLVAVKGSPAEVLAMCGCYVCDGERRSLSEGARQAIEMANERMAGNALRVLGVAYAETDADAVVTEDLVWLGLVGMADPLRHGVRELVGRFHDAGIDTVIITGDQSATAYAIGRSVDLSRGGELQILDSSALTALAPEVLKTLAPRVHVFARVSPAHKLQIVQALQASGRVVAMTGDGINDGPALKAADIGIAMGHTGTDVARRVADVVLEDDNLQTMIEAVSQGRTIYDNIRKSVHFLLATNLSEIVVMTGAIAAGMGQPLSPMQLLWINLVTDIFPGLALSLEAPEPDVLRRPPRDPAEPFVQGADFRRIGFEAAMISAGTLGAYGYGLRRYGPGPQAGTLAFMSLTLAQFLQAISNRSENHSVFDHERLPPNPSLRLAVGGSFAAQLLAALLPGLRRFLGMAAMRPADALVIGGGALLPFLVNETSKRQRRRQGASPSNRSAPARAGRQIP